MFLHVNSSCCGCSMSVCSSACVPVARYYTFLLSSNTSKWEALPAVFFPFGSYSFRAVLSCTSKFRVCATTWKPTRHTGEIPRSHTKFPWRTSSKGNSPKKKPKLLCNPICSTTVIVLPIP